MHTKFAEAHRNKPNAFYWHIPYLFNMYQHPYKAPKYLLKITMFLLQVALMTMWKKTNKEGRTIPDLVMGEMKTSWLLCKNIMYKATSIR